MRLAYLDCFAGIAGDMLLGALVDAGVPFDVLQHATHALNLNASLRLERVDRSGIAATKVHVLEDGRPADEGPQPSHAHIHPHTGGAPHGRSLSDILSLVANAALDARVKEAASRTFTLLGESEAKVHNVPVDTVHFHEVGAVDAIVDIVASCAGIVHLAVDTWHASALNVGGGTIECTHGTFPVPAPATADLLRGFPTYSAHVHKELITPTGAALIRALDPVFGPQPAMIATAIGYGAGTRNPQGFPNLLRLTLGDTADRSTSEEVCVLEAALDDATPQLLAHVADRALTLHALDVTLTPTIMKKGRPGTLLTLLCKPTDEQRFADFLLRETPTLGLRVRRDRRLTLERDHITVQTAYGPIRIKRGLHNGEVLNLHPEFEDCRAAAEQHNVPLKTVHQAALQAVSPS